MQIHAGLKRRIALVACGLVSPLTWGQTRAAVLPTSRWLVDVARDEALARRADPPMASDVRQLAALLKAAGRIDPMLPDPPRWLYELYSVAGDVTQAEAALREFVRLDTDNLAALQNWLALGDVGAANLEDRRSTLLKLLEADPKPVVPIAAAIHAHAAQIDFQRLDRDRARMQLDRALALDAHQPLALMLRLDSLEPGARPVPRLKAALDVLRVNPLHVEAAWRAAEVLDAAGLSEHASRFFQHAVDVHRRSTGDGDVPPDALLTLALSCVRRDDLAGAIEHVQRAIAAEPEHFDARMFLHWLLEKAGRGEDALALRRKMAEGLSRVAEGDPAERVAQAAWFYCTIDVQPERALRLAQAAAKALPAEPFAIRTLGWALALNRRYEQAQQTLLRVSAVDPFAAYQLARLMLDGDNESGARKLLETLQNPPTAGPAFDLLASLGITLPAASTKARQAELLEVLDDFDRSTLEYLADPARFVSAELSVENSAPGSAEPWWIVLKLSNRSSTPLALGPGGALDPVLMLSFKMSGDRDRVMDNLLTIRFERESLLNPGQTITFRQTIDLGPLRRASRASPQQLQRVTMDALLDPQRAADGSWGPSAGGQRLGAVYFNRLPAKVDPDTVRDLIKSAADGELLERLAAIETCAQLLGERQRRDTGRLSYEPEYVPAARLAAALLAALEADDWQVRTRALEAATLIGFDRQMLAAVKHNLKHEHWLVRLMAARLLGEREGAPFAATAEALARDDPDELVRDYAAGITARLRRPPTSQTANPPP
ncbi:MAG: hypothetical protein CHACPFDD_00480 [Phycisphaerae bacterium]|nr:hypothetical protein [Phycisphaerae bacterium]